MKTVYAEKLPNPFHQFLFIAAFFFAAFLISSAPVSAAFIDQGNGTVFDDESGLTWQQSDDGITRTWQEALEYSENLALANCTNWRLPNRKELRSLVDRTRRDPAIDPIFNSHSDNYWTSTPSNWFFNRIWSVDFYRGRTELSHPLNDFHYIRAVTGGCEFDGTPPEVVSMSPADGSIGIAITSNISAGFNEEINPATLTASSFTVKENGVSPIPGILNYTNGIAEFNPNFNLAYDSTYTVTLTTDIQDPSGNALLTEHQWSFSTEIELDTEAPAGSMSINSSAAYTKTPSVTLMLSASDNSGTVALMQFREAGGQWTAWEPFQSAKSWLLSAGEGNKTVEVQFQDHSGNVSLIYSDTITVDTIPPTVSIDPVSTPTGLNSQTLTGQTEIGSTVTVTSSTWATISKMSVTGTDWQCVVLGLASGPNSLTVVSTDAVGNVSSPATATIVYDNIAPTGTIAIDNGKSYTNTSSVILSITSSDNLAGDIFYRLANGGSIFSQWQILTGNQAELPWQLAQGDGLKTVLAQFQDITGNVASSITGSITIDTVPPSISVLPDYTETNKASITLTGTMEALSSLSVATDTLAEVGAVEYLTDTSWQVDVTDLVARSNTITVTAVDSATNSAQVSSEIIYDYEGPTGTLNINYGAAVTNSANVLLAITANDSNHVAEMSIRNSSDSWGAWIPFSSSSSWQLPAGDGDKIVEIMLRDVSGNISGIISDTIALDTSSPAVTINPITSPLNTSEIQIGGTREDGATVSISAQGALVGPVNHSTQGVWSSSLILREGTNSIIATATDGANNSSSASAIVILDSIAEFTINPPITPTKSNSQLISGTMENGSNITVNAGTATTAVNMSATSWSCQIDSLSPGDNLITIASTDSLGNTGSNSVTIYVDNAGPTGSMVINNGADLTSSPNIILFLSIVEDSNSASTVLIRNQGGTWSTPKPFSSQLGWTLPAGDGEKTVEVQFQDASGNVSPTYADSIELDTVDPAVTIDTVTTPTASATQTISGSREKDALVTVNASGGLAEQVSYPDASTWQCIVSLVSGQNTITAMATDSAGNRGSDTTAIYYDNVTHITINPLASPTKVDFSILLSGTRETNATVTINAPTATVSTVQYLTPTSWLYILDNLDTGSNDITVTATDLYGNSDQKSLAIFVDKGAPSGSISINNDADITNSNTVTLSFTYTDMETHVSLIRVRNSGQNWSSWMTARSSLSWSLLPTEGILSVDVEFQDAAGNISSIYSDSISVDRTAPAVTINPVISPTIADAQTLSGSMETDATVSIFAPGVTVGSIIYPTTTTWESELTSIPEGINTITVLASDGAGNRGSAATSIVVDNTVNVSINSLTSPTNQTSITVSGSREPNAGIALKINSTASPAPISFPTQTTWKSIIGNLQEGDNLIAVTSTDTLGNTGSASRTVTVDWTAPPLTVNALPALNNVKTVSLSGTTETGAAIYITAPGVAIGSITRNDTAWSSSLSLAEGNNSIKVTARDAAGNETSADLQTTLDTIAKVTITPLPYTSGAFQTLTGTIEAGSTIQLSVNTLASLGSATINGTSWQCPVTLEEGPNTFTVDATDTLGNPGQTGTIITLDSIDPTITIDPAPTLVSEAGLTITGTKSDDGLISINSPTVAVQALSYPTAQSWQANLLLGEGMNAITATATDPTGNSGSANTQISLDSIAQLTFAPLPSPTNAVSHTISGTFEEQALLSASSPQASVSPNFTINGSAWSTSLSLTEGENTITVEVTDLLGNNNSISRLVILDSIIPQVTIDPVPNFLSVSSVTLTGTKDSDGFITIRGVNTQQGSSFTLAGDLPSSTTWAKQVTLPDGENTITVTARDAAGNVSSASVTITVDTIAKVTMAPLSSPTNKAVHSLHGTMESGSTVAVSINGGASMAATHDTSTTWSFQATLAEGANQIIVSATDPSSNVNSITVNVFVDTTPPAQVDNLTATDTLLGNSVYLDWAGYPANTEGVALFRLYVSQTAFDNITGMTPLRHLSPGTSKFTVEGMTNGEIWHFALVGVDISGNVNPEVITRSAVPTTQGINGYVTDANSGLPLWGTQVRISDTLSTVTNREGYYHLPGLPTGSYDLYVSGGGYENDSSAGIIVQAAMMTEVNFSLTKIIVPPSIPQNVSATPGDGQVTIAWNQIPDTSLDGYQVFRFTSPADSSPVQINPELITGSFYVDMNLTNIQTYYYTVRSVDRDGLFSADSVMVNATPVVSPPLPASNLVAGLNPDNTIKLTWSLSPTVGVDTYNIYSDNGTGVIDYSSVIATGTATTTSWSSPQPLAQGETRYFGLRAQKNTLEEHNTTLVASVTAPVIPYSGPKVIIDVPYSGKTISGNLLTIEGALVQGNASQVKHVLFQFRQRGNTVWNDIAPASAYSLNPDIDSPYFIHWDVISDVPVGEYELRAVTTATDNSVDPTPETIVVMVDHANATTIEDSNNGKSHHRVKDSVRHWLKNTLKFHAKNSSGAYTVTIPSQASDSDSEIIAEIPKDEEMAPKLQGYASIGRYLRLKLSSGQSQFPPGGEVEITIPYPDADNNDIVDGTSIHADDLEIRWYNLGSKQWENSGIIQVSVDKVAKTVTAKTSHFSVFAVLGTDVSRGIDASTTSHDFGQQTVNSTSTAQAFTIAQNGATDVTIEAISKTGSNPGDFTITQDDCSNTTLTPSGTCQVVMTFTPTAVGIRSATLSIPSSDPGFPLEIILSGEGVAVVTDNDGDGMPDSWESTYGVNDPNADPDDDGVSNLQEYQNGTNPLVNEFTIQPTKVPVFNGLWLLIGTLSGLIFCRRRRAA